MDGEGSYFFENGNLFVGGWKSDQKHGKGKYFCKSGKILKEGIWDNGVFR